MLEVLIATVCLIWYIVILSVCTLGYTQIYRYYRARRTRAVAESLPDNDIPHITVIRPAKGLEPNLYECLASTFQQTYPSKKLTIYFCIASCDDPSYPILQQLVQEYAAFDVKILVENEDPELRSAKLFKLGPNPKIRNMSRAYREARGDLIWIIDCNVWVGKGAAGRMVDTLCGYSHDGSGKVYKLVHQLPLTVDVTNNITAGDHGHRNYSTMAITPQPITTGMDYHGTVSSHEISSTNLLQRIFKFGGSALDELFLSSAHAKFYTAINTVLIAPCIVGKSNMFRRSHLDSLTSQAYDGRPIGIDYFSHNICEDHLIGDLLWKGKVPEEQGPRAQTLGKHTMVFGDLALQPMAGVGVAEYFARRVRWLRVRKFTVTLATFVEPGTESFLCSLYGAYAITTLPWFHEILSIPTTWTAFWSFWLLSVSTWAFVDWTLYQILHSMSSIEVDDKTPYFARPGQSRKLFSSWLLAWIGREVLALPIWLWAFYGGTTVVWRGQKFRVGLDMRVHALHDSRGISTNHHTSMTSLLWNSLKGRRD